MRRFIFNESQFSRGVSDLLNRDILGLADNNESYFGNNLTIQSSGKNFILDTIRAEYRKLSEFDYINPLWSESDIENRLNALLSKCKEIERPHRDKLEKICNNKIVEIFEHPEDIVTINLFLVDKVDVNDEHIVLEPNQDVAVDDIVIKSFVNKRKVLLALCVGCGLRFAFNIDDYSDEISEIDPRLPKLYHEIMILNRILLYIKNDDCITDKDNKQIGMSILKLGNENTKTSINAYGVIFPVLYAEAIRCTMELFASHGLPQEKELANEVMSQTDFIKADPWLMRVGLHLWDCVYGPCKNIKSVKIPYLFRNISKLKEGLFFGFIHGSIQKTREWKEILFKLMHKSQIDADDCKNLDTINDIDTNKEIITDDYIHPEEL